MDKKRIVDDKGNILIQKYYSPMQKKKQNLINGIIFGLIGVFLFIVAVIDNIPLGNGKLPLIEISIMCIFALGFVLLGMVYLKKSHRY